MRHPVSTLVGPCMIRITDFLCFLEFTEHQRQVFCVFSGGGVVELRKFLNTSEQFAHLRDSTPTGHPRHPQNGLEFPYEPPAPVTPHGHHGVADAAFDEPERDVIDDDDGLDDGSEMMMDAPPVQNDVAVGGASLDASMIPPPPPAGPLIPNHVFPWNHQGLHNYADQMGYQSQAQPYSHSAPAPSFSYPHDPFSGPAGSETHTITDHPHRMDIMDTTPTQALASTATVGSTHGPGPSTASLSVGQGNNVTADQHSQQDPSGRNARQGLSSSSSPDTT